MSDIYNIIETFARIRNRSEREIVYLESAIDALWNLDVIGDNTELTIITDMLSNVQNGLKEISEECNNQRRII